MGVPANSLMSTGNYAPHPDGKPILPTSLLRQMILESAHLSEALTAVQNFPCHVSNNFTPADAEGFRQCFEITPDRVHKACSSIDDYYLVYTNRFTHPGFEAHQDILDR
jgi:isopenicillin-N N-acyltransferase-like protein